MTLANQIVQHLVSLQTSKNKANHDPKTEAIGFPVVAPGAALCEIFYRVNPNSYGDAHEKPHDSNSRGLGSYVEDISTLSFLRHLFAYGH